MDTPLTDLAARYSRQYGADAHSNEGMRQLYNRYVKERDSSILDAAAATAALDVLVFGDQIDTGAITPQMEGAFGLAASNVASRMTLAERLAELGDSSENERRGFLNLLKGKLFEVTVHDRLNDGQRVGDLVLSVGQRAELAPDPTNPGWDLRIANLDGSTNELLQLKATDSLQPISNALANAPEFRVLATDEGVDQAVESLLNPENVLHSGISDAQLEDKVAAPLEPLLDTKLENFFEAVAPGLPFVLIGLTEGTKVLMGRQAFELAVQRSVERGTKTGAAMAVGGLMALVGAGAISLPAAFATRIGIDRYRIQAGLSKRLSADTESIAALIPA